MKNIKKLLSILLVLSVFVSSSNIDKVIAKSEIKISDTSIKLYEKDKCKLKVTGTNKKIKWSSSNTSVAKVNQKGKVTAVKKGKCVITAKVEKKKLKCKVTVKKLAHTIYVTPTGEKYHYDPHCNGGTYIKSNMEEVRRRGLEPCKKCVLQ